MVVGAYEWKQTCFFEGLLGWVGKGRMLRVGSSSYGWIPKLPTRNVEDPNIFTGAPELDGSLTSVVKSDKVVSQLMRHTVAHIDLENHFFILGVGHWGRR